MGVTNLSYNKLLKKNIKDYSEADESEYVVCKECSLKCKNLSLHIRRVHHGVFSIEDYKNEYPNQQWFPTSTLKAMSDRMSQDTNPFTGHGGKYSPFSMKSGRTIKEVQVVISKASQNRSYTSRLDYWIERCDTLEEAEEKYSDRQRTFSLDLLVSKHGEAKGTVIFNERQERWTKTLLSRFSKQELRQLKIDGMANAGYIMDGTSASDEFTKYKWEVETYTRLTIRMFPELLEGNGTLGNHVDHILSKRDGFIQGIDPKIMGSISNLQTLHYSINCSKKQDSWKTREELETEYGRFITTSGAEVYREFCCRRL